MDFRFGALLMISAQICTTLALPPCVCTRNYTPVCGSDGKTYSNQCILNCEVFKTGNTITKSHDGSCGAPEVANCVCTFEYKPVCGSNGQTYPNQCSLNCQKSSEPTLKLSYPGPCEPPCICPAVYSPVCGSDGKIYGNDCELNCATKDNPMLSVDHSACGHPVNIIE